MSSCKRPWLHGKGRKDHITSTYVRQQHIFGAPSRSPSRIFFHLGSERGSPQSLPSISTLRAWPGGKGCIDPLLRNPKEVPESNAADVTTKGHTTPSMPLVRHDLQICRISLDLMAAVSHTCFERRVCPLPINKPKSTNSQVASS